MQNLLQPIRCFTYLLAQSDKFIICLLNPINLTYLLAQFGKFYIFVCSIWLILTITIVSRLLLSNHKIQFLPDISLKQPPFSSSKMFIYLLLMLHTVAFIHGDNDIMPNGRFVFVCVTLC